MLSRNIHQFFHGEMGQKYMSSRFITTMRSNLFVPTLKETPVEAAIPSHQLLLRAGYIRKTSAGIYQFLPLAVRTLDKIEKLIDEEMQKINTLKTSMPTLLAADLWHKTGRWESSGDELLRLQDRRDDSYCLSPTHEEIFTDLVSSTVFSHKQLPLRLYQIGRKYRDEIRPRFGLLRSKEFIMKDAYTFDQTKDAAEKTYNDMVLAYHSIFQRLKARYVQVQADSGNIGGNLSHEFHILSKHGEDAILSCSHCSYAANIEKAEGDIPKSLMNTCEADIQIKPTNLSQVLELTSNEKTGEGFTFKAFFRKGVDKFEVSELYFVFCNDNREINELTLKNHITDTGIPLEEMSALELEYHMNSKNTFKFNYFLDYSLKQNNGHVSENISHLLGYMNSISFSPSFEGSKQIVKWGNFRFARDGDFCPECSKTAMGNEKINKLHEDRGIEVGHVFYLGDKYSKSFNATYQDHSGKSKLIEMGCFGLGVTRIMQAVVESLHDSKGIIFPLSIAPYSVAVIPTGNKNVEGKQMDVAMNIAGKLEAQIGWCNDGNVVVDDRYKESLGMKLTEAELIGYPWVIIVGKKYIANEQVEAICRSTGESFLLKPNQIVEFFENKTSS